MTVGGVCMFEGNSSNAIRNRFTTLGSRHPVMRGCCYGSWTTTDCFARETLQFGSHMLPTTINVCLNYGSTCSVHRKSDERWGNTNVPVPMYFCTCPVAVSICTLGAAALNFWIGENLEKLILLSPELTTPVS